MLSQIMTAARLCDGDKATITRERVLGYLFWHRPYSTTTVKQYEEALLRFQQHLGQ